MSSGYSRLAGADDDRILARSRTLRSDLIDPTISVHHGRIVKRTGDGSSQHGSARVGNARESWRPARDRIAEGPRVKT